METETGVEPCDCDPVFPGAHIDIGEANAPESGELGVERCDACLRYEGDLDAAWAVVQVTGGRVFFYQNQNGVDEEDQLLEQSEKREFTGTYRDDDCIAYGTDPWIEGADTSKLGSGEGGRQVLNPSDPERPARKFLDLATCHLPENIMHGPDGPLDSIDGVIAYEHGEYGYFMWVPDDPQEHADDYPNPADEDVCSDEGVPAEVLAVQLFARSLGCDYVLFDRDADAIEALPRWEW